MAAFIGSVTRLFFARHAKQGVDEERGTASSTLGPDSSPVGALNVRSTYISTDDPLTFFRVMTGITTSPFLGFEQKSPAGSRPAPNLGIYTRVVRNEQKAKDSFKVFSAVINACFGLQLVVAAALTAMGAANTSHGAITAFGALNTVIAGFLTFLKGSGLPNRLKYYGNEWKKLREYIEQRERDFSREGCKLDVYQVVAAIEKMYEHTRIDIDVNTPDGYNSVTNMGRKAPTLPHEEHGDHMPGGGFDISKLEGLASKLQGLDGHLGEKVKDFAEGIEKRTHAVAKDVEDHENKITKEVKDYEAQVAKDIKAHSNSVARDVKDHEAQISQEARNRQQQASGAVQDGRQQLTRGITENGQRITDQGQQLTRGVSEQGQQVTRDTSEQGQQLAQHTRDTEQRAVENASRGIQGYADRAVNQLASDLNGRTPGGESSQASGAHPQGEQKHERTIP